MDPNKYIRVQTWATCVIAFFTIVLAGVGIQQCYILKEADRPLLTARVAVDGDIVRVGHNLGSRLELFNTGKTATMAHIKSTVIYSLEKIIAPRLPPTFENRVLVWPATLVTEPVEGRNSLTEGQLSDMKRGSGYIYVRAYVRYGQRGQYYTAIRIERKLRATPDGPRSFEFDAAELCTDEESNSAN